jgi:hypothetical protein
MADLGPQAERKLAGSAQPLTQRSPTPVPSSGQAMPQPQPATEPPSRQGFNLNVGSGPVGPVGVVLLAVAARMKRNRRRD